MMRLLEASPGAGRIGQKLRSRDKKTKKGENIMTFDKVKEVIADTVNIDEADITLESSLKEDLGIDSLDAVEISIALEDAFETSIPQEELANFVTVQNIVDYIDANKG